MVVHGEVLARPIDGGAEAPHLVGDGGAVLALPRPDPFGEGLAAEVLRSVPSLASWRSTIICVAMPAWSVPGTQREVSPHMRCQRVRMSISVWLSMWPMCRRPVTLGGGRRRVKFFDSHISESRCGAPASGVGTSNRRSRTQYSASVARWRRGRRPWEDCWQRLLWLADG